MEFGARHSFMKHKKEFHFAAVQPCEKFKSGNCSRNNDECWFIHPKEKSQSQQSEEQVLCEAQVDPFPPDQIKTMMEMVANLCQKVENVEMKMAKMINLSF